MIKQSKTQLSIVVTLGMMVLGQLGFAIYKEHYSSSPSSPTISADASEHTEKTVTHAAGSAKSFGLTSPKEKHFQVSSVQELNHVFDNWDYTLTKAKSEGQVPRLFLAKLPRDMRHQKKSSNAAFIQVLLPHILKANELILADRAKLLALHMSQKNGHHLRHSEVMWLKKLAADYRCKSTKIESLLVHVDIVPPSLALAQGIIETGGGRSPAVINKNSPFGHMATKTQVEKFESLFHSVMAYVRNLNRHQAYAGFRKDRARLRAGGQTLCGHKLAVHLIKYSERGKNYTDDLQKLIKERDLRIYDDHMRLKP
jgi:Bax protein